MSLFLFRFFVIASHFVVLYDVFEECSALLVEEVELDANYFSHEQVDWGMTWKVFLAVSNVLLVSEEADQLRHLCAFCCLVVVDKSAKGVGWVYGNCEQLAVTCLAVLDFAVGNLVIYS